MGEMKNDAPRRRDEDEERCCETCAHCGANYPLNPQEELYCCRIRPIAYCLETDATYEMVDLDDICERYVPARLRPERAYMKIAEYDEKEEE